MAKLVIFNIPDSINEQELASRLNTVAINMGFITKVNICEVSIGFKESSEAERCITILKDIVTRCGDPRNRLTFASNFYNAVRDCFGSTKEDTKIILNEIVKGESIAEVYEYARNNDLTYAFYLAKTTLGMLR